MTAMIASDLDRTLIYSRRFVAEGDETVCVEVYDGAPLSFMTTAAADRLRVLAGLRNVVPATTRTVAQFQRIELPGAPYRYAVTSNGGTILVDGEPDCGWRDDVTERIRAGGPPIDEIVAELSTRVDGAWVRNLRIAEGLFCYLVVDESALPTEFLERWRDWCVPRGWTVSRQGRKIYTVPCALGKAHAVAEVRRRLIADGALTATSPLLAAGDGALDIDLLRAADAAIRPSHGELHALGWFRDGLVVTERQGARAAEEILDWFDTAAANAGVLIAHPEIQ